MVPNSHVEKVIIKATIPQEEGIRRPLLKVLPVSPRARPTCVPGLLNLSPNRQYRQEPLSEPFPTSSFAVLFLTSSIGQP